MGSSFRWNDGELENRGEGAQLSSAWIPAFAGTTVKVDHRRTSQDGFPHANGALSRHTLHPPFHRTQLRIQHRAQPTIECEQHQQVRAADQHSADDHPLPTRTQ